MSTAEQAAPSASPPGTRSALHTDVTTPTQPSPEAQAQEEEQGEQDRDQILVAPTLAPTATPGVVYYAVQQVVEATNLEDTRFIGLSVADWINLAISLLLVVLAMTLIARYFSPS